MTEQLVLDLPQRVALGRDMFLVADSNREAVALIDGFAASQNPVQWIQGPAASGKTHLIAVLANQLDTIVISAFNLANNAFATDILAGHRRPDVLIIDALDRLVTRDEEALFHLINQALNGGVRLLLVSRASAARLEIGLADLESRLKAVPAVVLGMPDDDLVIGLLKKLFADRQLRLEPRVAEYLIARIDRDYAAMGRLVTEIDNAALAQQRAITVPLVAEILQRHHFVTDDD